MKRLKYLAAYPRLRRRLGGVYNTLAFFGSSPSYYCTEANDGWDLIDFLWNWNN